VWRVDPEARHADCATSQDCTVVADGFRSIVDITFGPDGTAYVVEFDESSFFAVETEQPQGGTISACDTATTPWTCTELATDLTMPFAATVTASGRIFAAVGVLIPGAAEIVEIT
jgi:hypothetical protein